RQAFIDVNEHRNRADGECGSGCGDPGVSRNQDLVSRPNPHSGERSDECTCAAVDSQNMSYAQLFLELSLEARRIARTADIVAHQFAAGNHMAHSHQFPDANTRHDTQLPKITPEQAQLTKI